MKRYVPIEPVKAKKRRGEDRPPAAEKMNPVVLVQALAGLDKGTIVHAVDDCDGISAYGLMEDERLEISIRPRSQYHAAFERRLVEDLKERTGPVLLFQRSLPERLVAAIEQAGLPVERIGSLSEDYLFDTVAGYKEGQVMELEDEHAAPADIKGVRELARLVKHAVACKLTARSIRNLQARVYPPGKLPFTGQRDLDSYLGLECQLPVSFDGTVIKLAVTGLEPGAKLLAAGLLAGTEAKVYFNGELTGDFRQLVSDQLNRCASPFAARNRQSVERWLDTEIDIELEQLPFRQGYVRYRNLFSGYNPGRKEALTESIKRYLDSDTVQEERGQARKDILFHVLTGLILDSLLPFIDADERWRVENKDMYLFVNSKRNVKAVEKFRKRDEKRRRPRKKRKGLIDYTCRKPRRRLVKGSKVAAKSKGKVA